MNNIHMHQNGSCNIQYTLHCLFFWSRIEFWFDRKQISKWVMSNPLFWSKFLYSIHKYKDIQMKPLYECCLCARVIHHLKLLYVWLLLVKIVDYVLQIFSNILKNWWFSLGWHLIGIDGMEFHWSSPKTCINQHGPFKHSLHFVFEFFTLNKILYTFSLCI